MGDAAEMILNGDIDEVTGEYIGEGDGYPRTLTGGRNKRMKAKKFRQTERLINHFPALKIVELQGNGVNVYLPGKCVITIWWQKNKYCQSNIGHWKYMADPANADLQMIAIIEGLLSPVILSKPSEPSTTNNVQKAIDHILNKAKLIGVAKGADHATATMLKTIAVELEQYL